MVRRLYPWDTAQKAETLGAKALGQGERGTGSLHLGSKQDSLFSPSPSDRKIWWQNLWTYAEAKIGAIGRNW